MDIGHIEAIAIRSLPGAAPHPAACAEALPGHGLRGDLHADPLSPRQVLLADAGAYRDLALPPHALRENLLVNIDTARLRSGTVLQFGADVRLRLMFQCEACGRLDAIRSGLARALGERRGMLARVLAGGILRPGDRVHDLGPLLPPWSDDWRLRVRQVLDVLPPGTVIEYKYLAHLAGVASTYCRAFPRMLKGLGAAYADKAVPAQSPLDKPRWRGAGLFDDAASLRIPAS